MVRRVPQKRGREDIQYYESCSAGRQYFPAHYISPRYLTEYQYARLYICQFKEFCSNDLVSFACLHISELNSLDRDKLYAALYP